jgi:hypothetical protein
MSEIADNIQENTIDWNQLIPEEEWHVYENVLRAAESRGLIAVKTMPASVY